MFAQSDRRLPKVVFGISILVFIQVFSSASLGRPLGPRPTEKPDEVLRKTGPGIYSVLATPYVSPRFDSEPVVVKAVTTDARSAIKGWRLTNMQIESRVGAIRSIVISCFITSQDSPGVILSTFESPELPSDETWKGNTPWDLELELVSHRDLLRMANKQRNLFQVDVAVTRVQMVDGTVWKRDTGSKLEYLGAKKESNETQFINASLRGRATVAPVCPKTACNYYYSGHPCEQPCLYWDASIHDWVCGCTCNPNYYYCVSNTGPVMCTLGTCNQSCSTTTCP